MRVLVRYSPKERIDVYDGTRLRKSLKNSLELAKVDVVDSYSDAPEILHFISPNNEKEAVDARANKLPVVVSALYSENDPYSRYLEENTEGEMVLSKRAIVLLKAADLILVPSKWAKDIIEASNIKKRIEILPPPLAIERFYGLDYATKNSFYHYYMVPPNREHVIVKGDLNDIRGLKALVNLATELSELDFYFFGLLTNARATSEIKYQLNKITPPNLRFCDPNNDDLYRSGLSNASFYLSLSYRHNDAIGVSEAFAANVQVLRLGPSLKGDTLDNDELCLGADNETELAALVRKYRQGKIKTTIINGKRVSLDSTSEAVGPKIKSLYEELLKGV